jgi:hypothetical protein
MVIDVKEGMNLAVISTSAKAILKAAVVLTSVKCEMDGKV